MHIRVEEITNVFVVVFQTFQDKKRGQHQENLSVTLLQLFSEILVLFGRCFDHLTEVEQLVAFLCVKEVGEALTPRVFKFDKNLNELVIVL